jgi:hypothetical protein
VTIQSYIDNHYLRIEMQNTQHRKRTMKLETFYLTESVRTQINQALMTSPACVDMNKSDFIRTGITRLLESLESDETQRAVS